MFKSFLSSFVLWPALFLAAAPFVSPAPHFVRAHHQVCIPSELTKRLLHALAEFEFANNPQQTEIISYIDSILEDGILEDPQSYLNAWTEQRGMTREWRLIEDPALHFFRRYLENI